MKAAIPQKTLQHEAWVQLSNVLDPAQIHEWTEEIQAWENDPSCPNPYAAQQIGRLI
jgi:hypothetical protein